jgi:signal transduction histidine kinase
MASSASSPLPLAGDPPGELFLRRAFASFSEAAGILERSYAQLQAEVTRLRRELEGSNLELAHSLEENRRARQHLQRILHSLPCGVLFEEGGVFSILNPEAQRLLATSSATEPIEELPPWLAPVLRRFAGEEGCGEPSSQPGADGEGRLAPKHPEDPAEQVEETDEQILPCPVPGVAWLAVRRAALREPAGGAIFILRDVSQAKRLEEMQELWRRRQALAELSAVLAHEVRNPLGSLELFGGLLLESPLDPQAKYWAGHLQSGLRRLAATVNNVLQFYSGPPPALTPLALGPVLEAVGEFLRPQAERARVHLAVEHTLAEVRVAMDAPRIEQLLLNLALNAMRAMPQGGILQILGSTSARTVRVEVRDTGTGIAGRDLPRIFEPGYSTLPGSPGLGLAVCRMIAEQHHGALSVTSLPEIGSVFVLELPENGPSGGGRTQPSREGTEP